MRGVHEQLIKTMDNMVQNYLANMRRALQRFQNFVGSSGAAGGRPKLEQQQQQQVARSSAEQVVGELQQLRRQMRDFNLKWARTLGQQQSPLIDRIPPRGVELWRDFWDTMRKQVRRINQEFWTISRDMSRLVTGGGPRRGGGGQAAMYASEAAPFPGHTSGAEQQVREQFQEFYDKLTASLSKEQQRLELQLAGGVQTAGQQQQLGEDFPIGSSDDDEATRQVLDRNVALRQQIQQEINVFGSIFDIMRAFIQRLRESATHIRDVLTPPGSSNNNDAVTPGPQVKPQVDALLEETVDSQRNINGQAPVVALPKKRPQVVGLGGRQ